MEFQTLGISYPVKVKIPPTISSRNGWIAVFDSNPFYIEKRRKRLLYSVKSPLLPRKYEDHQKRLALPEWQIVCIWSFDKGGATVELTSLLSIGPRGFGTVPFWRRQNLKHGIQRSQCILCKLLGWSSYFGAEVIAVPDAPIKFLVAFLTFFCLFLYRMFWVHMPLEILVHIFFLCVVIFRLSDIVAVMAVSQTFGCLQFFWRIFYFLTIQVLGFDKDKGDESFGIWVLFSVEYNVAKILSTV